MKLPHPTDADPAAASGKVMVMATETAKAMAAFQRFERMQGQAAGAVGNRKRLVLEKRRQGEGLTGGLGNNVSVSFGERAVHQVWPAPMQWRFDKN